MEKGTAPLKAMPRIRSVYDMIDSIKAKGIVTITHNYYIRPIHFIENYMNQMLLHRAPAKYSEIEVYLQNIADVNHCEQTIQTMRKFAAIELSVQPFIRRSLKQQIIKHGLLFSSPTEEGKKVLDPFHPSYRVKHINGLEI